MKAVVAAFNQEKALVGAFSVITNLRMELGCNFLKHYDRDRISVPEARGEPHRGPEGALQQLGPEGELRAGRDTGAVSSSSSSADS